MHYLEITKKNHVSFKGLRIGLNCFTSWAAARYHFDFPKNYNKMNKVSLKSDV